MLTLALTAAAVAAAIHVIFFVMESLLWRRRAVWSQFVDSQQDAETARPIMWNQGFYNLFLALGAFTGIALMALDAPRQETGAALVAFTCASMLGAALVLATTGRRYASGAALQGIPPLVALVALLVHARS